MKHLIAVGVTLVALAGCATTGEPFATSHTYDSPDGMHRGFQITMRTGVPNTPQQTVLVLYNRYQTTPIAVVDGQTKVINEKLWDDIVKITTSLGTAAVAGGFAIEAAKAGVDCPHVTQLCGTLVQVATQAGANANSTSSASSM